MNLSCKPENMNDTNKLLFFILQELKKISGTAKEEEANLQEAQIRAREDEINAMTRAELMAEIKEFPEEEKPFGWTKLKTEEMREMLREAVLKDA